MIFFCKGLLFNIYLLCAYYVLRTIKVLGIKQRAKQTKTSACGTCIVVITYQYPYIF